MSSIRFSIDLEISNSTSFVRNIVNINGFHCGDSIDLMVFFFFLKGQRVGQHFCSFACVNFRLFMMDI